MKKKTLVQTLTEEETTQYTGKRAYYMFGIGNGGATLSHKGIFAIRHLAPAQG